MSNFALRWTKVEKRYGKTVALDRLDLDVPKGALLGLVGPNGAGKTTAFGAVSGAITIDGGTIDVLGDGAFDPARHAGRVTILPQDCELNPHSSARQLLTFYARLSGMDRKRAAKDVDRVLELVRLTDRAGSRVRQLSHGMRRRLAVAQALLGEPELVLLDEPTGGLDPHLVVEMRDVLKAQRGKRTMVVSSHILADLEATCDHVAFMESGRCVKSGRVDEVTKKGRLVTVRLAEPIAEERIADLFEGRDLRVSDDAIVFALRDAESAADAHAAILPALIERGARIAEIKLGESLEAAYMATRRS